jgi:hypothetical protein
MDNILYIKSTKLVGEQNPNKPDKVDNPNKPDKVDKPKKNK